MITSNALTSTKLSLNVNGNIMRLLAYMTESKVLLQRTSYIVPEIDKISLENVNIETIE